MVRRRGRAGSTSVADAPPLDVLASLSASPAESQAVNRLVDRRLLFECAVTHYAAVNATAEQLDELERLTRDMAEATDWSVYHLADERFHQLMGAASGMGTAVEVYHETLAELYDYFIPYSIEKLHKSNEDHVALVAALRACRLRKRWRCPEARGHPAPDHVHGSGAGQNVSSRGHYLSKLRKFDVRPPGRGPCCPESPLLLNSPARDQGDGGQQPAAPSASAR